MSDCTFHLLTPYSVPEPPLIRNGWRMEARYCKSCGERFTRRLYRIATPHQHGAGNGEKHGG